MKKEGYSRPGLFGTMKHMMMAMMIYTWMAIMIMIGMIGIVIMPMVWMTQWMNLTRIGKYGR